jgi:Fur family transcriptional regulator, ferric uptake regulator
VTAVPGTEAIERTLDAIRVQGGRVTDQRRAILRVLFEQSDHVTVDDLASRVHDRLPDVHVTTVYRFLDTLEEMGLVSHVHLGHGPAVYHLSDRPHAHVVCDSCGAVGAIDEALLDAWSGELRTSVGFTLVEQHFALAGRCDRCAAAHSPA